jgi:hypothetical protein
MMIVASRALCIFIRSIRGALNEIYDRSFSVLDGAVEFKGFMVMTGGFSVKDPNPTNNPEDILISSKGKRDNPDNSS